MATTPKKSAPKRVVTDTHKAAMASGREAASAVNAYLKAFEATKPKRGRQVSIDDLKRRLVVASEEAGKAAGTAKLLAIQTVADLEKRIDALANSASDNIDDLEERFLKHAKAFSDSKGISYATWRKMGVPADLLKKAGISRGAN